VSQESRAVSYSAADKYGRSGDLEYVSIYMMANQDKFPSEVRDYYLGQIEGLNKKIKTIKSALERYPKNQHINAQLAMTYKQKIDLYSQMGLLHNGGGGPTLPGDFSGNALLRGGCHE
jgi:hypothetical protein